MATRKQHALAAKVIENGGNVSKAMIEVGYSPVSAKNPQKFTASKGLNELLAASFKKHGITLDDAIAPISKALKATKIVIHGNKEDAFAEEVEDLDMQLKGSDRVLKIMGVGQNENGGQTINNFILMSQEKKDKYGF